MILFRLAIGIDRQDPWWTSLLWCLLLAAGGWWLYRQQKTGVDIGLASNFLGKNRLFVCLGGIILIAVLGFYWSPAYWLACFALLALASATTYDYYYLYSVSATIRAERLTPKVLSLGDESNIRLRIQHQGKRPVMARVIDELPFELQQRDHYLDVLLPPGSDQELRYVIKPLSRGDYHFGKINLWLSSPWKLAEWHLTQGTEQTVAVYPSILQMQHFALKARTTVPSAGQRRLRRLAKSYEFDQIRDYVPGDDLRSINWRATSRQRSLMVNQYKEERSQRIFCFIDKGRTMLMPFAGLSLLDYAINATLALSKVVLARHDRAGLVTFSDQLGTVLGADSKPEHLRRILEALYRQQERQVESNYDLLFHASRKLVGGRSLIILFSNFASNYALDRVLPGLRRIAQHHQLVIVLFENTEIAEMLDEPVNDIDELYRKVTAREFLHQQKLMAARLRQNGIRVLLTRPENLTGDVINKYLELKQRGLI